jgi:MFS superfamily sulfate permease-like transporter
MAYSFILLARFLSMPADAVLGRVRPNGFHDLAGHPDAKPVPGLLVYRFSAPLFFMNCTQFRRRVEGWPTPIRSCRRW